MVMTMSLIPFSDDTFRIVARNDISNDQLKYLNSQMRKDFHMEGIHKLGGVKYKSLINIEESEDPYILLDLLWKSKQLTFSHTSLWLGIMKIVF